VLLIALAAACALLGGVVFASKFIGWLDSIGEGWDPQSSGGTAVLVWLSVGAALGICATLVGSRPRIAGAVCIAVSLVGLVGVLALGPLHVAAVGVTAQGVTERVQVGMLPTWLTAISWCVVVALAVAGGLVSLTASADVGPA
jgi:hypothetical protein